MKTECIRWFYMSRNSDFTLVGNRNHSSPEGEGYYDPMNTTRKSAQADDKIFIGRASRGHHCPDLIIITTTRPKSMNANNIGMHQPQTMFAGVRLKNITTVITA